MVKIHKDILDQNADNVPNKSMTPKYITVHNTANTSNGADAEMHARYQHNGSGGRNASWHYTVDDTEIWQTLEDNQQGWHAGDGSGNGNTQSIGIEVCENSDGDFDKAVENAQWLIRKLMDDHNISLDDVVTHKRWSGKNCPRKLLGNNWDHFINGIEQVVNVESGNLAVDGSWGPATTRALQRHLGTTVDGVISGQPTNRSTQNIPSVEYGTGGSQLIRAMQRHFNSGIVDGIISGTSNLITAMQNHYDLDIVDGYVSNPSNLVKAVQRMLNSGRL